MSARHHRRGVVVLKCISDSSVPEHLAGVSGCGGGRGRVRRRLLPPPAGQDGHAVLFAQILLRTLTSFNLSTQNSFLLDHLHHGGVSGEPQHLKHTQLHVNHPVTNPTKATLIIHQQSHQHHVSHPDTINQSTT